MIIRPSISKIFLRAAAAARDSLTCAVVAARGCLGTSRREAADAMWGGAGMMTARRDLLGALAWLAQTACAALLTC